MAQSKSTDIKSTKRHEPKTWEFEFQYPKTQQSLDTLSYHLPEHRAVDNIYNLLDQEDPKQKIEALPPQTLFKLMQLAEWEDARQLLVYVTPYQLQCCLDMIAWRKDEIDTKQLEPWFEAIVELAPDEVFVELMREIDSEIPALLFKKNILAEPIIEDEEPFANEALDWHLSPDGTYAIADISDEDSAVLMRALIDRLYDADRVLAWTLIEAAQWEQWSEMEYHAYHWRTSRMEELGFPERTEALSIYKFVSPSKMFEKWRSDKLAPKQFSKIEPEHLEFYPKISEKLLLFDALEDMGGSTNYSKILAELVTLQNYALIGAGIEPGNQFRGEAEALQALGYLNIGVEFLSQNNLEDAKLLLKTLPLREIFSTGYSTARTVKKQIAALEQRSILSIIKDEPYSLLNNTERALFEAVNRDRPLDISPTLEPKPFIHLEEVQQASDIVRLVAFKQLWFFTTLNQLSRHITTLTSDQKLSNSPIDITFDLLFRTANANSLIHEKDPFAPFNLERLSQLIRKIQETPKLASFSASGDILTPFLPFMETIATEFPQDALRHASQWLTETIQSLTQELGDLVEPNPQFLQTLLLIEK